MSDYDSRDFVNGNQGLDSSLPSFAQNNSLQVQYSKNNVIARAESPWQSRKQEDLTNSDSQCLQVESKGLDCFANARNDRKCAFTLAETLITLVIIGVVAALTIPNLIVKYQKEQTVNRLKKTYSALAQTTNRAIADNGPIETWEVGEDSNADDAKIFIDKYVIPYLNISKAATTYKNDHWNNERNLLKGEKSNYGNAHVRFYMSDGTSVTSKINDGSREFILYIDVNGDKKPNKYGKDIFVFVYPLNRSKYIGQIFPFDTISTTRTYLLSENSKYNCNKNTNGTRCAALIMLDGWQIKDDYPW